jgi:hypothetical protein
MKQILEKSRSPLLKNLMLFFVEIYKTSKAEVKELLASDPTSLAEIEFDLKQFEKSRRGVANEEEGQGAHDTDEGKEEATEE